MELCHKHGNTWFLAPSLILNKMTPQVEKIGINYKRMLRKATEVYVHVQCFSSSFQICEV